MPAFFNGKHNGAAVLSAAISGQNTVFNGKHNGDAVLSAAISGQITVFNGKYNGAAVLSAAPAQNKKSPGHNSPGIKTQIKTNALSSNYLISTVQAVSFDCLFPHLVLEDLACSVHRESFDEVDISRNLVLSHVIHDELLDLFFG